jgi:hypothetical protein
LSFICSPERQAHGEGRSLVVAGAFRANFAVIRLDDRPGDSEPEPQGAKLLRDGFIGSMPTVWLAVLACFGSFGLPQTSAAAKPDQSDKPDFSGTWILDRQASTSFDPLMKRIGAGLLERKYAGSAKLKATIHRTLGLAISQLRSANLRQESCPLNSIYKLHPGV